MPGNPIHAFDGQTISYTYDNGWSFTNRFDGRIRHSAVPRGDLAERVEVTELRPGLFFLSWIDDEMGLLAQTIDLESGTVLAAIPGSAAGETAILRGQLDT